MSEQLSVCGKDVSGHPCMRVAGHAPPCLTGIQTLDVNSKYGKLDIPRLNLKQKVILCFIVILWMFVIQTVFDIILLIKVF